MAYAARAIIIEDGKMLVMHRNKYGDQYYTLVGGRLETKENMEQALVREVKEETGLVVTAAKLVFIEDHPAPYNEQYIYYCEVAPHGPLAIQADSEEGLMNRADLNTHTPEWVRVQFFAKLAFRTPQLQNAIVDALADGFPENPKML